VASHDNDTSEQIEKRIGRIELMLAALIFIVGDRGTAPETRQLIRETLGSFGQRVRTESGNDFERLFERLESIHIPIKRVEEKLQILAHDLQTNERQLHSSFREAINLIDTLEQKQKALSASTHEWLAIQSFSFDAPNICLPRFIPLRVYLSQTSDDTITYINRAIGSILDAFGFEFADEFPAIRGSWYKKWFAKTAEVTTQPEVTKRLEKLERALELKGLGYPQAEIDAKQAAAVAELLGALKDIQNAAIQVGSILLIKQSVGPMIQVRTLTQAELIHLENNQALLSSPHNLLERLSDICRISVPKSELAGQAPKIDGGHD
jgi:hypothetical protein